MARLIGPDSGDRATVRPGGAGYARLASVVVYAAASGDTLANILTEDGDAVADSTLTTDDFGLIPLFQFPDGVDTVYVEVDGGPRTAVYARYDDRVDGLAARVATLETTTQVLDGDLTTIAGLDSTTAGALVTDGSGWIRKTYAQLKTAMSFVKGDVGLGNVDNTSDVNKPISTATQTALDLKLSSSTAAGTFVTVVEHGATASTARPAGAGLVMWVGTVEPSNGAADDLYQNTATPALSRYSGSAWQTLSGSGGSFELVEHGAVAGTARPDVDVVYWVGSVTPTNAETYDLIYNTSGVGADLISTDEDFFSLTAAATGEETIPRWVAALSGSNITMTSQSMRLTHFTARRTETINSVRCATGATAAGATPTLVRLGIYTYDPVTGITLVASSANDTTKFAATATAYDFALSAPFSKVKGTKYAIGLLVVTAATAPTMVGCVVAGGVASIVRTEPRLGSTYGGLSALPASANLAAISGGTPTTQTYFHMLP